MFNITSVDYFYSDISTEIDKDSNLVPNITFNALFCGKMTIL